MKNYTTGTHISIGLDGAVRAAFSRLRALFIAFLLTGSLSGAVSASEVRMPVKIIQDGVEKSVVDLVLIDKMGYLSSRDAAGIFSAGLDYDASGKKITLRWEDRTAEFRVGSEYAVMEGIKRKMMKTPRVIGGVSYIPLEAVITRAFQSASGSNVKWSFPHRSLWVSYKGNITDIRNYSYDSYTRFVIELAGDMEYTYSIRGRELKISVAGGRLISPVLGEGITDDVITGLTVSDAGSSAEFTLSLGEHAGAVEIMKFPSPVRIVADIENSLAGARAPAESLPIAPAGPAMRDKVNIRDINLVVIDPGHGGRDPGAIGPRGVREKDVVLEISKKLAERIRSRLKIRTVMTRTGDFFVPLGRRTEIANTKGADIFISIHANASLNPESEGFEVFFLSEDASDREAQAVANLENSVLTMEKDFIPEDRVSRILWSLTMNQFMNESSELCSFVNTSVIRRTGLTERGVKQAGFHVMRGARMPSILVEVGFISNRREETLLNTGSFQDKMADAICDAVEKYREWVQKR